MDTRWRRRALSPNQTRQCIFIKQQLAKLIRCANHAERLAGFDEQRQKPPPNVVFDQSETLSLISHACADGIRLEHIQSDIVDRLIDASVVGELAWRSIRQVMDAASLRVPDPHTNPGLRR